MARSTPSVENGYLCLPGQEPTGTVEVPVGSQQWYVWLDLHQTFRVKDGAVTYTARKEPRAGLWYWYAYRRRAGRLRRVYLGKSATLTWERLEHAAQLLTQPAHTRRRSRVSASSAKQRILSENLSSGSARRPIRGNLPAPPTSFVGRTREAAEATHLLTRHRLLTLTGVGGIGKTRLALSIADSLAERFPGGRWFVDLAGISAPAELLPALALALGLQPKSEQDLLSAIQVAFQEEPALLILDNCEHLLDACAPLAEQLLRTNPTLHVLATSREMLGISGETILPVMPLSLPEAYDALTPSQASQAEAVQLLLERIVAIRPSFALHEHNIQAIVRICRYLEGIPLALELAAARLTFIPAEQFAQMLEQELSARFQLLTTGKRAAAARHQTLRATLDWSYRLLSPAEQRLLRRLSLFAGGWTIEQAETICTDETLTAPEILDLLGKLVSKSLVLVGEETLPAPLSDQGILCTQARYRMLETIREYSREKLQESEEEQHFQDRYRNYFLQLAQQADAHLRGSQQLSWLARLDAEHDNLQAALRSSRQADLDVALRLTSSLAFYWMIRSQFLQGRKELDETLALVGERTDAIKAECLYRASLLAFFQGDMPSSRQQALASQALFQDLNDQAGMGRALSMQVEAKRQANALQEALALGEECAALLTATGDDWTRVFLLFSLATIAMHQGKSAQALAQVEESLRLMRQQGDRWGMAMCCNNLGKLYGHLGNYARAIACFEESLCLARAINDSNGIATSMHALAVACLNQRDYASAQEQLAEVRKLYEQGGNLAGAAEALFDQGYTASLQGDFDQARAYFERSATLYTQQRNQGRIALIRYQLGRVAVRQRDVPRALDLLRASCTLFQQSGQRIFLAACLEELAALSILLHRPQSGALWLGQAQTLHAPTQSQRALLPDRKAFYEKTVATLKALLTPDGFAVEFARGQALPLEHALREIQDIASPTSVPEHTPLPDNVSGSSLPCGMTEREIEVLRLLATGLSNREIAESLSISPGTVRTHLSAIYSKLAVHSRTAAVHTARARRLL